MKLRTSFEELAAAIAKILKQRDWQLIGPDSNKATWDAFVQQVASYLSESAGGRMSPDVRLDRAVMGAYCPILYEAACADGSRRQHRAFEELDRWIFVRIRGKIDNQDDAKDVTQETLEAIYPKLGNVRDPRWFLAYVSGFIRNQIKRYYGKDKRKKQHEMPLIYENDGGEETGQIKAMIDDKPVFGELELAAAEQELRAIIDDCFSKRAWKQKFVFMALVFQQRSVLEVADMLETTPNGVHGRYFMARQQLANNCPELINRLALTAAPSARRKYTGENS